MWRPTLCIHQQSGTTIVFFLNCILLINASFTWNADTLWWNVNIFLLASGLVRTVMSAMSRTQLSRNKLIPALFLPGITSDKHKLNIGFPLWFAVCFHIARPPPPTPSQYFLSTFSVYISLPHTPAYSQSQQATGLSLSLDGSHQGSVGRAQHRSQGWPQWQSLFLNTSLV